jgi:hypothetical protein
MAKQDMPHEVMDPDHQQVVIQFEDLVKSDKNTLLSYEEMERSSRDPDFMRCHLPGARFEDIMIRCFVKKVTVEQHFEYFLKKEMQQQQSSV